MLRARRGDVYLVKLNPTRGDEIRNVRLCLVVSPDELNQSLNTTIVAPMTTGDHPYPFRIPCEFRGRDGYVVLDQLRTIDRRRLIRRLGTMDPETIIEALSTIRTIFED